MEIERSHCTCLLEFSRAETKKISWKWRLKVSPWRTCLWYWCWETKKISWKWRLKVQYWGWRSWSTRKRKQRKSPENGDWKTTSSKSSLFNVRKQRKSPENGDWKLIITHSHSATSATKQKKSPENGDWKKSLLLLLLALTTLKQRKSPENGDWKHRWHVLTWEEYTRNKENLLKMEIESCSFAFALQSFILHETKKISWKWRLKGITC